MTIQKTISKSSTKAESSKNIFIVSFLAFLLAGEVITAQEVKLFTGTPADYQKRTVHNLRIRENGSYKGSVYRETRERYTLDDQKAPETVYSGYTFVLEEFRNDGIKSAKKVDDIIEGSFFLTSEGTQKRGNDSLYPLSTGFPFFPDSNIAPGAIWDWSGDMLVDPLKEGTYTRIGFICRYCYEGVTDFRGIKSHLVTAQYALRYRAGDDPNGDSRLQKASGSHRASIYLTFEDPSPYFIQDNVDETFEYQNLVYHMKGFSHSWYTDIVPMQRDTLKTRIESSIAEKGLGGEQIEVSEKREGVFISISTLHFVPDSDHLLPGEEKKVSVMAEILADIPERGFMVTGHTADVGTAESQFELSVKRARHITELLANAGIDPDRMVYAGKGGTEPAADNSTEEGRARNRRVEITILED